MNKQVFKVTPCLCAGLNLLADQCLVRYSDRKRPDIILANIEAFLFSKLLCEAALHMLCGYVREHLLARK